MLLILQFNSSVQTDLVSTEQRYAIDCLSQIRLASSGGLTKRLIPGNSQPISTQPAFFIFITFCATAGKYTYTFPCALKQRMVLISLTPFFVVCLFV